MSGTSRAGSYRRLLRRPHVVRTFVPAMVGRFGYGALPLLLLFTVRQATGSFAVAAGTMAALGRTTLAMPVQSRLVDRFGQRRVLPVAWLLFACALAGVLACASARVSAAAPWPFLGAALGLPAPALGPAMRARWRALTRDTDLGPTAYALDGVAEEAVFLLGPIAASAMLALGPARHGLPLVAALLAVGVAGLALAPGEERSGTAAAPRVRRRAGPLARPGFPLLVIALGAAGLALSCLYTGVAARAGAVGHPEYAGWIEAAVGTGSVVGGLAWGSLRPAGRWTWHLAGCAAALGCGMLLAAAVGPLVWVGVLLGVAGLAVAPTYVVGYGAADTLVPDRERTEASTWVTTGSNLGTALGSAAAGVLIDGLGARAPFVVGATVLGVLSVALTVVRRPACSPANRPGRS